MSVDQDRTRRVIGRLTMVLALGTLPSCTSDPPGDDSSKYILLLNESSGGSSEVALSGQLTFDRDCVGVTGKVVIWPKDTNESNGTITMANGDEFTAGDEVSLGGEFRELGSSNTVENVEVPASCLTSDQSEVFVANQ